MRRGDEGRVLVRRAPVRGGCYGLGGRVVVRVGGIVRVARLHALAGAVEAAGAKREGPKVGEKWVPARGAGAEVVACVTGRNEAGEWS